MFVLPDCAQLFLHEGGDIEVIIIVAHNAVVFDKGGSLYLFAQIIGYGISYYIVLVYDIKVQAVR